MTVKDAKLKKDEIIVAVNKDGIRIINYEKEKNVIMFSTFRGPDFQVGCGDRGFNNIMKPTLIFDYNKPKGRIDLSY